jgi:hypothetical protein
MAEPSGLLLFLVLFVGVLLVIGLLWLISRTKAFLRGEPFLTAQRFQRAGGSVKDYGSVAPVHRPSPAPEKQAAPEGQKAGIKPPAPVSVSVSGTDTADFDLATVPSDLTYEEVVTILAGQMTPAGKPAYSGKKIYGLVGGNYNEFTALMRQLRSKDDAPAEPPQSTTPIAGRQTHAAFRETSPELEFQPPPR